MRSRVEIPLSNQPYRSRCTTRPRAPCAPPPVCHPVATLLAQRLLLSDTRLPGLSQCNLAGQGKRRLVRRKPARSSDRAQSLAHKMRLPAEGCRRHVCPKALDPSDKAHTPPCHSSVGPLSSVSPRRSAWL